MTPLVSRSLTAATAQKLDKLQEEVDQATSFERKVSKAQELWRNRTSNKAFEEIKTQLSEMCVSVEVCNYCENNEAGDIEHIAPKSFFPARTFLWENYLLACKICNTGYKLDKCWVLNANGEQQELNRGQQPTSSEHAFINPRTENPNDYMILNLETFKYMPSPKLRGLSAKNKVDCTLKILKLNERDQLIRARRQAAKYFYERIDRLAKIVQATDLSEIEDLLTPYSKEIEGRKLSELKAELKESFKKDIQTHQHPSVWYAIKLIASKTNKKWMQLFDQIPKALEW